MGPQVLTTVSGGMVIDGDGSTITYSSRSDPHVHPTVRRKNAAIGRPATAVRN